MDMSQVLIFHQEELKGITPVLLTALVLQRHKPTTASSHHYLDSHLKLLYSYNATTFRLLSKHDQINNPQHVLRPRISQ
jgi:hypothetical protein